MLEAHLEIKGQRGLGEDLVGGGEVLPDTKGQVTLALEAVGPLLNTAAAVHAGVLEAWVRPLAFRLDALRHSGVADAQTPLTCNHVLDTPLEAGGSREEGV